MRFASISSSIAVIAALALAPAATAQFSDNFDSYTAGSAIEGQAGWQNWDICATGNQAFNTVSTAQAASGANSLRMIGSTAAGGACAGCSDTTHEFGGAIPSGVYTFTANTYIPTGFVGSAYVMLLNEYGNCGGPYNWSCVVHLEGTTGDVVTDNTGGNRLPVNGDQLIIYDQWVQLRYEIDLPNNTVSYFYNNVEMHTDDWLNGGVGTAQIATIDLFPGSDDTTEWFVDDISITGGVLPGQIGTSYCDPAVANSTGVPSTINGFGSATAADNNVTLTTTDMPNGSFGYYLTSMTQGNVPMPNMSLGTLCLGGAVGRYVGAGQIMNTGMTGQISLVIDLTQHPTPTGLISVTSGQTWNFQMWHRDVVAGMLESNFSNGLQITFI